LFSAPLHEDFGRSGNGVSFEWRLFAANIPLVAMPSTNFIGFSQDNRRTILFERQIADRIWLRYNPARWCS
jgi:hypothetical protein